MRALLTALILAATCLPATAATVACTAEAGLDWYSNPEIGLSRDFSPAAGRPVLEIDLDSGAYTDRFEHRDTPHRGGVLAVLQQPDKASMTDFVGWDAANRLYLVVRVWVDGMPFMFSDKFGDAFGGHCVEQP